LTGKEYRGLEYISRYLSSTMSSRQFLFYIEKKRKSEEKPGLGISPHTLPPSSTGKLLSLTNRKVYIPVMASIPDIAR
jgi:hypothetical protein